MTRRALLVLVLVMAAACGTAQPARPAVGTITYEVSGGFTGWDRILIVDPDGTAHLKTVNGPTPTIAPRQVDGDRLARLHALVSDPRFAQLEAQYLPPPGGADLQDYAITVVLDGKLFQTMTRDGAQRPEILGEVMEILNGILTSLASP